MKIIIFYNLKKPKKIIINKVASKILISKIIVATHHTQYVKNTYIGLRKRANILLAS